MPTLRARALGDGPLTVQLSAPEHGWVDLTLTQGDRHLSECISDVPNDFVRDGMVAIAALLVDGTPQRIDLSLEPGYLVMSLTCAGDVVTLAIAPSHDALSPAQFTARGNMAEIILPLAHALQSFCSAAPCDPHWPQTDPLILENLSNAMTRHGERP